MITARLSITVIPSLGHFFSHILQPMQPASQYAFTITPLSLEAHLTMAVLFCGTISMRFFGQMLAHFPQPMHFSLSITAIPFSIVIAFSLHTFTQLPRPMQPYSQAFGPVPSDAAATQSSIPKISHLSEHLSHEPLQCTTANFFVISPASTPMIFAIC